MTAIVGDASCLWKEAEVGPFVNDYRGLYCGKAVAVAMPSSTEQVSAVMKWCHEHGVPVVPQGGNTSLMGGAIPDAEGRTVVLSLKRMNRVLAVDAVNDTLTVQAGVTLHAAREAAENAGRLFPLRIGSEGSCQIGGNLATNAGGTAVLRYGNMRDLVLGIEAVLPDGRVCSGLRGLRKDNTGYDLKQLFIGSEGTLGVITAAVLKLMPESRSTAVALVAVPSPQQAIELLMRAKATAGPSLTAFELMSAPALTLVLDYLGGIPSPLPQSYPWCILVELSSAMDGDDALDHVLMKILESGQEDGIVLDAAIAASLANREAFWRIREEISDAQTRQGGSVKCDVSVPLSRIADFIEEASRRVLSLQPRARMIVYGHMGDGNVHFNPLRPPDISATAFIADCYKNITSTVDQLAHEAGGSISAEHGIGVVKRDDLTQYKSKVELELMWQLKRALDPKNLMNPFKVLPIPTA
jgi:FAD/FMN-containing dehydrogenase